MMMIALSLLGCTIIVPDFLPLSLLPRFKKHRDPSLGGVTDGFTLDQKTIFEHSLRGKGFP